MQLVRDQLIDSIINVDKLLNSTITYAKMDGADIESSSLLGQASHLATAQVIKAYVDAQVPDTFGAGDGIAIDTSGNPDVISVDLGSSNPGLYFDTAKLSVLLKVESGGSISKDAGGLYIANSAISNAKLANSTISGVALGANLADLTAGNGLSMTAYNGAGAQVVEMLLDGATLFKSASGVKVNALGIDTAQLANSSVTSEKMAIFPTVDTLTPDNIKTTFDLSKTMGIGFTPCLAFRNGVALQQVAASPTGTDQFLINRTAGSAGKSQIEFGSAINTGESVQVFYMG